MTLHHSGNILLEGAYIQWLTVELLCCNCCGREGPTVIRTLRVRLHPGTAANGQYLEQLAGACRFAWNHVLAGHETDYRTWKTSGQPGRVRVIRTSSRWAGGSRSCGTHPATSG
ncbi:MAG: helix-turn-helix domain-containing protein [Caldilineaceae bacterium SB0665_bin_21]|nr:helix-turn-helix domain-containing protein [Caldilineaceae bacterium SB0665_bin_21]MYA06053.1 helix-turn-helix domain-containing protein [Caldilineaceae bacterium SB0664_bin_22]